LQQFLQFIENIRVSILLVEVKCAKSIFTESNLKDKCVFREL